MQEHFTNRHIKLHTAGFQLGVLTLIALSLVFPFLILLPNLSSEIGLNNVELVISIVLFGALGGCFSGVFSISRDAGEGKIPDQILSSWLTIARPVVGVMAALAMAGFLLSGIVQLGTLTVPLILAVSFAVGFSERLLSESHGVERRLALQILFPNLGLHKMYFNINPSLPPNWLIESDRV